MEEEPAVGCGWHDLDHGAALRGKDPRHAPRLWLAPKLVRTLRNFNPGFLGAFTAAIDGTASATRCSGKSGSRATSAS